METHSQPAQTVAESAPSELEILGCKAVRLLFLSATQSSLPTKEFWRAIIKLAGNDPILRASLNPDEADKGNPNPKEAQKPIEI